MKVQNKTIWTLALATAGLVGAAPAQGGLDDPLFTFGFTELDGDYNYNGDLTGTFTAQASSEASGGPFNTAGDVTRVLAPNGTADYDVGFVDLGTDADVQLQMQITGVTNSEANGVGQFTITDVDGDSITGQISGSWARLGGFFGSFRGVASNVTLNAKGDGIFEGPSGGSWNMDLPFAAPYNGAIIVLETGNWFTRAFNDTDTQVEAAFVPVPGGALLAAIGIGLVSRRRRGHE
jgi:hypothetical protein